MRLIDADALLERMRKDPLFPLVERYGVSGVIDAEPTVEPYNFDEWCEDCKEYDNEKHCCLRFNRVIRTAMEECEKGMGKE